MAKYNSINQNGGPFQTVNTATADLLSWDATAANGQGVWPPSVTPEITFYVSCFAIGVDHANGKSRALNGSAIIQWNRSAGTFDLTWQQGGDDILTPDASLISSSIEVINDYPRFRLRATGISGKTIDWDGYWTVRSSSFS